MARFLRGSILRSIVVAVSMLVATWVHTPVAWAQHGGGGHGGGGGGFGGGGHFGGGGGGHFGGGGGGHFGGGGGGHFGGSHAFAPHASHGPVMRPRGSSLPPPMGAGVRTSRFQHNPPHVVHHHHAFFGPSFRRFHHGFYSYWWPYGCPYYWGWSCYGWPSYWYGYPSYGYPYDFGTDPTSYSPGAQSVAPMYAHPAYRSGGERRDLIEFYLKDGTAFDVTDYWLEDGKIHFTTPDGSVEQVIGVDQLDLQTTVDVNTRRGLRFVLRNEPAE